MEVGKGQKSEVGKSGVRRQENGGWKTGDRQSGKHLMTIIKYKD